MRRIAGKNKVTGFTSHGEWQDWDADTAKEIAERANLEFPIINHWVEEEEEPTQQVRMLSKYQQPLPSRNSPPPQWDDRLTPYQRAAIDRAGTLSVLIIRPGLGKGEAPLCVSQLSEEPSDSDAVVNLYRP